MPLGESGASRYWLDVKQGELKHEDKVFRYVEGVFEGVEAVHDEGSAEHNVRPHWNALFYFKDDDTRYLVRVSLDNTGGRMAASYVPNMVQGRSYRFAVGKGSTNAKVTTVFIKHADPMLSDRDWPLEPRIAWGFDQESSAVRQLKESEAALKAVQAYAAAQTPFDKSGGAAAASTDGSEEEGGATQEEAKPTAPTPAAAAKPAQPALEAAEGVPGWVSKVEQLPKYRGFVAACKAAGLDPVATATELLAKGIKPADEMEAAVKKEAPAVTSPLRKEIDEFLVTILSLPPADDSMHLPVWRRVVGLPEGADFAIGSATDAQVAQIAQFAESVCTDETPMPEEWPQ